MLVGIFSILVAIAFYLILIENDLNKIRESLQSRNNEPSTASFPLIERSVRQ